MHHLSIHLTEEQRHQLDVRARAEGMSRAELVRQLLDRALHGESDRLTADLSAIADSFGALDDTDVDLVRADGDRGAHVERIALR